MSYCARPQGIKAFFHDKNTVNIMNFLLEKAKATTDYREKSLICEIGDDSRKKALEIFQHLKQCLQRLVTIDLVSKEKALGN